MSKSIWDDIINAVDTMQNNSARNWDRYAAAARRKTSGPRWRIVKRAAAIVAITGVILLIAAYWLAAVCLFFIAVCLALAAKS